MLVIFSHFGYGSGQFARSFGQIGLVSGHFGPASGQFGCSSGHFGLASGHFHSSSGHFGSSSGHFVPASGFGHPPILYLPKTYKKKESPNSFSLLKHMPLFVTNRLHAADRVQLHAWIHY